MKETTMNKIMTLVLTTIIGLFLADLLYCVSISDFTGLMDDAASDVVIVLITASAFLREMPASYLSKWL
jgi:hypothetical protein